MKLKKFTVEKALEDGRLAKYEEYVKNLSVLKSIIKDFYGNLNKLTIKDENNKIIFKRG